METNRPVLWLVAGRVAGLAGAMAIPMVLARALDPAAFGAYRELFVLYATLYAIAQAGMAESLYYFIPRDRERAGRFAAGALVALAALGVACAALLTLASGPVAALAGDATLARWLPLLGVFLLLMLVSAPLEIVLQAERRYRAAACTYAASDFARAACLLAPLFVTRSVAAVMAGAAGFAAARVIVTLAVLGRGYRHELRPATRLLREHAAYAVPFAAAVVVDTLQAQLHFYVVAHAFDTATFAVYSVACFQIPLVDHLATSAGNVLMVRLGHAPGEGGVPLALWRDATAQLALVFVPLVAWLVVTGPDLIVLLFGPRYAASGPLFALASASVLWAVLPVDAVLRACAETRFLLAVGVVRLIVLVALLVPLVAWLGLPGAVWSTLGAGLVARAMALARIRRRLHGSLATLLPWRTLAAICLAAGTAALAVLAAQRVIPAAPGGPRLLLAGLVFVPLFLAAAVRLRLLDRRLAGATVT